MLSLWSEVFLLAQRSISPLLSTKDVVPDPVGMEQQVSLVRDWLRLATDKHAKCRRYLREMRVGVHVILMKGLRIYSS
jgi:hypothetical protein